jgi:hypothetical protein
MKDIWQFFSISTVSSLTISLILTTDSLPAASGSSPSTFRKNNQLTNSQNARRPNSPIFLINTSPDGKNPSVPTEIIEKMMQDAHNRFKMPNIKLEVSSSSPYSFSDTCLQLPNSNENCAGVKTEGWVVYLKDDVQTYLYRSNITGSDLRANPTPQYYVAKKIQQVASKDSGIAAEKLVVSSVVESKFKNNCLNAFKRCRDRSIVSIDGWKILVENRSHIISNIPNKRDGKKFIYHIDKFADKIIANKVAAKVPAGVNISLDYNKEVAKNVIFESSSLGFSSGTYISHTLTDDGELTIATENYLTTGHYQGEKQASKKIISPRKVKIFKSVLAQQNFDGFSDLKYQNFGILDGGVTTYHNSNGSVSFLNVYGEDQPPALQVVGAAWSKLIDS